MEPPVRILSKPPKSTGAMGVEACFFRPSDVSNWKPAGLNGSGATFFSEDMNQVKRKKMTTPTMRVNVRCCRRAILDSQRRCQLCNACDGASE